MLKMASNMLGMGPHQAMQVRGVNCRRVIRVLVDPARRVERTTLSQGEATSVAVRTLQILLHSSFSLAFLSLECLLILAGRGEDVPERVHYLPAYRDE